MSDMALMMAYTAVTPWLIGLRLHLELVEAATTTTAAVLAGLQEPA